MPLLGTGLRAAAYPALLWNGARLHHAAAPEDDGLVLVALAAAPPDADAADVDRAVAVGRAVAAGLPGVIGDGAVTASPTIGVVAAAACAAVAGGTDPSGLGPVLDVAAALMVVAPPVGGTAREAGLRAGHCLAAGWLAPRVLGAGLTGMPGALTHTVSTVIGRPAGGLPADPSGGAPVPARTGSHAGGLLAGLA
ncbi:hypothetical protein [Blastococcus deserti]|uniref:Uncharacterized protein n=1 Tax=Blastococcus deserti TaxID=2259033 RepID=A0ABW4XBX9_9ACTN